MRRAILAITGLAASTTALVVLKASPDANRAALGLPSEQPPVVAAPAGTMSPGAGPTPGGSPIAASARPDASASARPSARTSSTVRATAAAPATTVPPKPTTVTVTGPVVRNQYGTVQVQITLTGTRIVNAVALQLPDETPHSVQRSDQVDARYSGTSGQVVQRQSADLDTVSGATATSNSYKQSLQAAIDAAR